MKICGLAKDVRAFRTVECCYREGCATGRLYAGSNFRLRLKPLGQASVDRARTHDKQAVEEERFLRLMRAQTEAAIRNALLFSAGC